MECRLCGSNNTERLENDDDYHFCKNCELIYLDKEQIVDPDEEYERYREHDNTHQNEGYVNMFLDFIDGVIEPYSEEIEQVLDFGCGPGPVLADLLKNIGLKVDVYDPYFFPEPVYENREYDLITSTEVFEHLEDPYTIISRLKKHLKQEGYLAVMTMFHPGPEDFSDWFYTWDPTHITFYNIKTFEWIAEEFELDIAFHNNEKYCLFRK